MNQVTPQQKTARTRWCGKLPVPQHTHPCVRKLFEEANDQMTMLSEVSDRAGLRRGTVSAWRYHAMPRIDLLDAALNVLGLELCVRKRRDS